MLGLGTWKAKKNETKNAVLAAIRKAGVLMIDTANDYDNEPEIGEALRELFEKNTIKRSDIFIQSKLWNSNHRPDHVRADLNATLRDLGVSYVDSFIIHWPMACPSSGAAPALRVSQKMFLLFKETILTNFE
jgi:diketogulonate reductase-like aldo/keto reductase